MTIKEERSLTEFNFWCGAIDTYSHLTYEDLKAIEEQLSDMYPDGITETEINDLFWFEQDEVARMLGYEDWEDLIKDREEDEEEEEE
jgi:hypothetical protein